MRPGYTADPGTATTVESVAVRALARLGNIAAVGNDLALDDSVSSPTLLIAEMTVSGAG